MSPFFRIKVAVKNSHKFNILGQWNGDRNMQIAKAINNPLGKYLQCG